MTATEPTPAGELREASERLKHDAAAARARHRPVQVTDVFADAVARLLDKIAWMVETDEDLAGRVGFDETLAIARACTGRKGSGEERMAESGERRVNPYALARIVFDLCDASALHLRCTLCRKEHVFTGEEEDFGGAVALDRVAVWGADHVRECMPGRDDV